MREGEGRWQESGFEKEEETEKENERERESGTEKGDLARRSPFSVRGC